MPGRNPISQKENRFEPDARGQAVLSAIIDEHLVTGEPIGSRVISDRFAHRAGWSSATIRNVMAELEESGLVEQPHTSAGRTPTDKGYRYYVDNMLDHAELSGEEKARIDVLVGNRERDTPESAERLLERASHALSEISENVGIVISPSFSENSLQRIEFVKLGEGRILVVLVSKPNIVHNKLIRIDEPLSQEELERTARYLNSEFGGKTLRTIRNEIIELMRAE